MKGKKGRREAVGSASFSIPAGKTTTVELTLNATGRALLGAGHGRLSATLTILQLASGAGQPMQTHTEDVRLVQQKAHGEAKK